MPDMGFLRVLEDLEQYGFYPWGGTETMHKDTLLLLQKRPWQFQWHTNMPVIRLDERLTRDDRLKSTVTDTYFVEPDPELMGYHYPKFYVRLLGVRPWAFYNDMLDDLGYILEEEPPYYETWIHEEGEPSAEEEEQDAIQRHQRLLDELVGKLREIGVKIYCEEIDENEDYIDCYIVYRGEEFSITDEIIDEFQEGEQ
ncbi:MAG: hypothetical protein GXO43_06045 [Crenarchaeota archaeon]|nr:hypothetical protein [Thermoproteota archaeon]